MAGAAAPAMVEDARPWWPIVAAIAIAGNSMVVALAVNLSEVTHAERTLLHAVLGAATLAVMALVGRPLWQGLAACVRQRRLGREALFVCGILGATALSAWAMVRREGSVYLEVVSVLLAVYALGQRLKTGQQQALVRQLESLGRAPAGCLFVDDPDGRGARRGQSADIRAGDLLRLDLDSLSPVDGQVVAGRATFDLSSLTGEPMGREMEVGDELPAGSLCLAGFAVIRAASAEADSSVATMRAGIASALAQRSHVEALAERTLAPFTAAVVGAAVATAAFWGWHQGSELAFLHGMAVLLVACPCALGFATPVGMWTAAVRLARRGVVVRSTAAIEQLAHVGVVALDKTGTLTELALEPADLMLAADASLRRCTLVAMVQAAQASGDHPIARAFRGLAAAPTQGPRWALVGSVGRAAAGILLVRLRADGDAVEVAFCRPALCPQTPALATLLQRCPAGTWPIAICVDGRLQAVAALREVLTAAARRTAAQLRALRLPAVVLSGDCAARAQQAAAAGLGRAYGGLSPQGKRQAVEQLGKEHGAVCVVGDGVNDAAAMAASQVSMAMAGGAGLPVAIADFTLPIRSLDQVGPAIQIARQTLRAVRGNLALSACYNVAGMAAAAAGLLHPAWAALSMVAASMTVTWRSARLLEAVVGEPAEPTIQRTSAASSHCFGGGKGAALADGKFDGGARAP